jgi:hypothetical protein
MEARRHSRPAGLVVPLLLLAAVSLAGCFEGDPPARYLLSQNEIPSGLHNCEPNAEMRAFGIETNPGTAPPVFFQEIQQEAQEMGVALPENAWFQILTPTSAKTCELDASGASIILLLAWENAAGLQAFLQPQMHGEDCTGNECAYGLEPCQEDPMLLYEDRFLLFFPEDAPTPRVRDALWAKNPSLQGLCGPM